MKRDFDLIRKILLDVEAAPALTILEDYSCDGYDHDTVVGHVEALIEADLIQGELLYSGGDYSAPRRINLGGLTWRGHDFLDSMKDDGIWSKAKRSVLKKSGGIAFDVLLAWLKAEAMAKLKLPHGG